MRAILACAKIFFTKSFAKARLFVFFPYICINLLKMKYFAVLTSTYGDRLSTVEAPDVKHLETLIWSAAVAVGVKEGEFTVTAVCLHSTDVLITAGPSDNVPGFGYVIETVWDLLEANGAPVQPQDCEIGFGSWQEALAAGEAVARLNAAGK